MIKKRGAGIDGILVIITFILSEFLNIKRCYCVPKRAEGRKNKIFRWVRTKSGHKGNQ